MAMNFEAELINCDHILVKTRIFTKKCQECKKHKWPWSKAVGCIKCMKVWHRRCQPAVVKPLTVPLDIPGQSAEGGKKSSKVVESLTIPLLSAAAGDPSADSVAMTAYGHFAAYHPRQRTCSVVIDSAMIQKVGGELLHAVPLCLWLHVSHPVEWQGFKNIGATVRVVSSGSQWPSIVPHLIGSAKSVYADLPLFEDIRTRVAEPLAIAAAPALLAIAAAPALLAIAAAPALLAIAAAPVKLAIAAPPTPVMEPLVAPEEPAQPKKSSRCTRILCKNRRCIRRRAIDAAKEVDDVRSNVSEPPEEQIVVIVTKTVEKSTGGAVVAAKGHFAYRPRQRDCHVVIDRAMALEICGELLRTVPLAESLHVSHPVRFRRLEDVATTVTVVSSGSQWPSIALHPTGPVNADPLHSVPARDADLPPITVEPPALLAVAAPPAEVVEPPAVPGPSATDTEPAAKTKSSRCIRQFCKNRRCVRRREIEAAKATGDKSSIH